MSTPAGLVQAQAPAAQPPIVEIRQLWSAFRSGGVQTIIHQDLDLNIAQGELLSIVGGSGAAKRCCCGKFWAWRPPCAAA